MLRPLYIVIGFLFLQRSTFARLLFTPHIAYGIDRTLARRLTATAPKNSALGGTVLSNPGCLARSGHKVHCFFVTDDNAVGYAVVEKSYAAFRIIGGYVKDGPQVVEYGRDGVFALFLTLDDEIAVVAVNTITEYDNKVTVLNYGTFLEAPGCTMMARDDYVFCVVRSTNGGLHAMWNRDGTWDKPYFIADNPNGPLDCGYNTATTRIHCWSTSNGNILQERVLTMEGYPQLPFWFLFNRREARGRPQVKMLRGWIPLPRALGYSKNEMVDNFASFGGNLASEPSCVQPYDDVMDCFALDQQNGLQRNYELMGVLYVRRTSGWVHYDGSFVGKPSCVYLTVDRQVHCFIRDEQHQLVESVYPRIDASMHVT